MAFIVFIFAIIAGISAFPSDPVILKTDHGPRYTYLRDDSGTPHLVDQWMKVSDLEDMLRYDPDASNVYHLFTRANPSVSQPLVLGDVQRVDSSNYDAIKRSVILMHGFVGSAVSEVNTVLVPAYLAAADVNVIVIDWSAGSYWGPHASQAGQAAGRFVNWLNSVTGSAAGNWTAVGFSVGGHGVGHLARTVQGTVSYVISLDPSVRWNPELVFSPNDGAYTEVIHTSDLGQQQPLGQVDFYPNGGRINPGCLTPVCNHARAYFFLAESLLTGGFTGTRCNSVVQANSGACAGGESLRLGGLEPKIGSTGIFIVRTNARQPFSQG